jgi:hypothetical protein
MMMEAFQNREPQFQGEWGKLHKENIQTTIIQTIISKSFKSYLKKMVGEKNKPKIHGPNF